MLDPGNHVHNSQFDATDGLALAPLPKRKAFLAPHKEIMDSALAPVRQLIERGLRTCADVGSTILNALAPQPIAAASGHCVCVIRQLGLPGMHRLPDLRLLTQTHCTSDSKCQTVCQLLANTLLEELKRGISHKGVKVESEDGKVMVTDIEPNLAVFLADDDGNVASPKCVPAGR